MSYWLSPVVWPPFLLAPIFSFVFDTILLRNQLIVCSHSNQSLPNAVLLPDLTPLFSLSPPSFLPGYRPPVGMYGDQQSWDGRAPWREGWSSRPAPCTWVSCGDIFVRCATRSLWKRLVPALFSAASHGSSTPFTPPFPPSCPLHFWSNQRNKLRWKNGVELLNGGQTEGQIISSTVNEINLKYKNTVKAIDRVIN